MYGATVATSSCGRCGEPIAGIGGRCPLCASPIAPTAAPHLGAPLFVRTVRATGPQVVLGLVVDVVVPLFVVAAGAVVAVALAPAPGIIVIVAAVAWMLAQGWLAAHRGASVGASAAGIRSVDAVTASPAGAAFAARLVSGGIAVLDARGGRDPLSAVFDPVPASTPRAAAPGPLSGSPALSGPGSAVPASPDPAPPSTADPGVDEETRLGSRRALRAAERAAVPLGTDAAPAVGTADGRTPPAPTTLTPARGMTLPGAPTARPATADAAATGPITVTLDTGKRVTFTGGLLVGRNPAGEPGGPPRTLLGWPDLSRTSSKTHALLEWEAGRLWVTDLSTNGTDLADRDGRREPLVSGVRTEVPEYWTVVAGDRTLTFARPRRNGA